MASSAFFSLKILSTGRDLRSICLISLAILDIPAMKVFTYGCPRLACTFAVIGNSLCDGETHLLS